jgi:RNA-binding protein
MATDEITSPKKRSLMPSGGLRRALRGHGHGLAAIVQIGKLGVTRGVVQQVQQALADHELIKIKIGSECPLDRYTVAARLGREPGISIVQVLGRVILAYKRHPSAPRYEGKRAKVAADAAAGTATPAEKTKAIKPPRRTTGKAGARARASR